MKEVVNLFGAEIADNGLEYALNPAARPAIERRILSVATVYALALALGCR